VTEDEIASDIRRRWRADAYGVDAPFYGRQTTLYSAAVEEVGRLVLVVGEAVGVIRMAAAVAVYFDPRLAADLEDDAARLRRETELTLERMRRS